MHAQSPILLVICECTCIHTAADHDHLGYFLLMTWLQMNYYFFFLRFCKYLCTVGSRSPKSWMSVRYSWLSVSFKSNRSILRLWTSWIRERKQLLSFLFFFICSVRYWIRTVRVPTVCVCVCVRACTMNYHCVCTKFHDTVPKRFRMEACELDTDCTNCRLLLCMWMDPVSPSFPWSFWIMLAVATLLCSLWLAYSRESIFCTFTSALHRSQHTQM